MSDKRFQADKLTTKRDIDPKTYTYLYLPFEGPAHLYEVYLGIVRGHRDLHELAEILQIFEFSFDKQLLTNLKCFYSEHTSTKQSMDSIKAKLTENAYVSLILIYKMLMRDNRFPDFRNKVFDILESLSFLES